MERRGHAPVNGLPTEGEDVLRSGRAIRAMSDIHLMAGISVEVLFASNDSEGEMEFMGIFNIF